MIVPCPVCDDGEVPIFAKDGTQTEFTVRCPCCHGFQRVCPDDEGEDAE